MSDSTTIQPGFLIRIVEDAPSEPCRQSMGVVQAVDQHGIRIAQFELPYGLIETETIFVPWHRIYYIETCAQKRDWYEVLKSLSVNGKLSEERQEEAAPLPAFLDEFISKRIVWQEQTQEALERTFTSEEKT